MSTKQIIVIRTDLRNNKGEKVRTGKLIAQACHASLGVFSQTMAWQLTETGEIRFTFWGDEDTKEWFEQSFTKICVGCDSEEELEKLYVEAKLRKLPCILITDNGTTEFNGVPTKTCIAIGPAQSHIIDKITGHLKLL